MAIVQYENIIDFAKRSLSIDLTPGQTFILKMVYEISLDTTRMDLTSGGWKEDTQRPLNELEYALLLAEEGRLSHSSMKPTPGYRDTLLCLGRRSGKDLLIKVILFWEVYSLIKSFNPQLYLGADFKRSSVDLVVVSPSSFVGEELRNEVRDLMSSCEDFKPYLASESSYDIFLNTGRDLELEDGVSSIRISFLESGSRKLLGKNKHILISNESAFHTKESLLDLDSSGAKNLGSKDPQLTPKRIQISTLKEGTPFSVDLEKALKGQGVFDTLAIKAPTWEVNNLIKENLFRELSDTMAEGLLPAGVRVDDQGLPEDAGDPPPREGGPWGLSLRGLSRRR